MVDYVSIWLKSSQIEPLFPKRKHLGKPSFELRANAQQGGQCCDAVQVKTLKRSRKMTDLISLVHALRRPALLIRAAAHGLSDYNRARTLKRLTPGQGLPGPRGAVASLLSVEANLEQARRNRETDYSVSRHVEVMIALLAEARLLAQPQP
jgi:hypothetical protein